MATKHRNLTEKINWMFVVKECFKFAEIPPKAGRFNKHNETRDKDVITRRIPWTRVISTFGERGDAWIRSRDVTFAVFHVVYVHSASARAPLPKPRASSLLNNYLISFILNPRRRQVSIFRMFSFRCSCGNILACFPCTLCLARSTFM